jgi:trans-aconitate 2-methyltransferase
MLKTSDDATAAPWDAADYVQHSGLQEAMASEVLALLNLRGSEHVLDIGCGDGRLTARIAAQLPDGDALGVDASPDMVRFASSTFARSASPSPCNLRFEVADARALPYHRAFDLIVSFNALHWVPEQALALRGIAAAMRQSGRAQLRLVVKGDLISLEAVAEQVRQESRWAPHFNGFHDPYLRLTADEYTALAEHEGLHVVTQRTHVQSWDFQSDAAFFGFCKAGFGAWTRRLPPNDGDDYVRDVIGAYQLAQARPVEEKNVFRFYQMDIALTHGAGA